MPSVETARPVSRDRHRAWSWRKPDSYSFARTMRTVPVTLAEAASAASCFPLVFSPGRSSLFTQVLLRRAAEGMSPFIGREGQWQAAWLPPRIAAWPFDLLEVDDGHALAWHETNELVIQGPGGIPVFAGDDSAALSPEAARLAAILKTHAEALPATMRAAAALHDLGLLTPLDGDGSFFTVDAGAAWALNEADVVLLHRAGALFLLHAGLVSLAHLPWMEKAEKHLAVPRPTRSFVSVRQRAAAGSSFLTALAADASADEPLVAFPGHPIT
jgi:hypothetical protein